MLITDMSYRTNRETGDIVGRQKVKISCDRCDKVKETEYREYKSRKNKDNDYCKSCSNLMGITGCGGRKGGYRTKVEVTCENCNKNFKKYRSSVSVVFCSSKCSLDYKYKEKYKYILNNWEKYYDELCYLMGTILGDGTLTEYCKNGRVKRIAIFCNTSDKIGVGILKDILEKIKINYSITEYKSHCLSIGFSFPSELLDEFNLNFCGDKYKANPIPSDKCKKNINFAVGLFNSDGYFVQRKGKHMVLSFNNTVKSLIDSMIDSLNFNGLHYRMYIRKPILNYKVSYDVYVERQGDIEKLMSISKFRLKEMKQIDG